MARFPDRSSVTTGPITGSRKIYREFHAETLPATPAKTSREFSVGGNRVYLPLST